MKCTRVSPVLGMLVIPSAAIGQEPVHHDVMAQIRAEGLERSQVMFYER